MLGWLCAISVSALVEVYPSGGPKHFVDLVKLVAAATLYGCVIRPHGAHYFILGALQRHLWVTAVRNIDMGVLPQAQKLLLSDFYLRFCPVWLKRLRPRYVEGILHIFRLVLQQ